MTRAALADGIAFELTKIRTLRSMGWTLATFLVVSVALAVLSGAYVRGAGGEVASASDPVAVGHSGLRLGVIALVVLGVLTATTEFSTGTIHSSLTAVPRRRTFLAAKLVAGAVVALVASALVVVLGFVAAQVALGDRYAASVGDPGVLRSIVGGVLYATLLFVFAAALGGVLRSSALTIGILVPLLFMVSTVLTNIPGVRDVAQYLPDVAGGQILYGEPQAGALSPWTGLAVLAGWTALAVIAADQSLRRRDP